MENSLVSSNQPGFKPGDSWLNQLLSITHEIYKSFVCGCEVRFVFLDISKAFGKVFHGSIRFKLEQNAILKKNFMVPFYGWHSNASRLRSHYEETIYSLPLVPRNFWYSFDCRRRDEKRS